MRVTPRWFIGAAILVAYAVYLFGLILALGVDYDEITDSTRNVVLGIVIPVGGGAVILSILTTWLGWWRPALFERPSPPRWLLVVPLLVVLAIAVNLLDGDIADHGTRFLVWLAIGALFVGFTEELLTRGLLVVAFRGSMGEVWVWFLSSLAFGLLHSLNFLLGQGLGPTIQQLVFTFFFGTVFYVIRRVSGTLILCILLHAVYDFSIFVSSGDGQEGADAGALLAVLLLYVALAVVVLGARPLLRSSRAEPAVT